MKDIAGILGGKEAWAEAKFVASSNEQKLVIILDDAENTMDCKRFFSGY